MLWSQFDRNKVTGEGLLKEWKEKELIPGSTLGLNNENERNFSRGFTLDLRMELDDQAPGQQILSAQNGEGKSVELKTGAYGSIEIMLCDGEHVDSWISDPGLLPAYGPHDVSVTVDDGPKIIQFVVDGILCNGKGFRQFGWGRFKSDMKDFDFERIETGELAKGQLKPRGRLIRLRIYHRPLMNTEIIGNHRAD